MAEMARRGETIPDPSKVLIGSVGVTQ